MTGTPICHDLAARFPALECDRIFIKDGRFGLSPTEYRARFSAS